MGQRNPLDTSKGLAVADVLVRHLAVIEQYWYEPDLISRVRAKLIHGDRDLVVHVRVGLLLVQGGETGQEIGALLDAQSDRVLPAAARADAVAVEPDNDARLGQLRGKTADDLAVLAQVGNEDVAFR